MFLSSISLFGFPASAAVWRGCFCAGSLLVLGAGGADTWPRINGEAPYAVSGNPSVRSSESVQAISGPVAASVPQPTTTARQRRQMMLLLLMNSAGSIGPFGGLGR